MTPRQLDLAHEFCEKVSADDLLDYLGLAPDASADEARAALKAKRRKMQGMQSNPKFRDEARLLIRHFQSLDAVLAEPSTHVRDMARRRESSHLPILEMTIRGVLAGGPLTSEQENYLRSNAAELGVSARTFDALLHRLQVESEGEGPATPRTGPIRSREPDPASLEVSLSDIRVENSEDPGSFDVSSLEDIDLGGLTATPTHPQTDRVERTEDSGRSISDRLKTPIRGPGAGSGSKARSKDKGARRKRPPTEEPSVPASSSRRTRSLRPPGEHGDDVPSVTSAATAPPVRMRTSRPVVSDDPSTEQRQLSGLSMGDGIPGGMEIVGDVRRSLEVVGRKPADLTIRVRLLGELPVAARVVTDDPWLTVTPDRLSPTRREHMLTVTVLPDKMYSDEDQSTVRLFNDLGEQVEVAIVARRSVNWSSLFIGVAAAVGLVALGLGAYWSLSFFAPNNASFLQVVVSPTSEAILLDGDKIGAGELARLDAPPAGMHRLTVVQRNFKTYEAEIELQRDEGRTVEVDLQLESKLDFRPRPDATRGKVADPNALQDVRERMERCTAETPRDQAPYALSVTTLFRADGSAGAVRMTSDDAVPNAVALCLRRAAAAAQVSVIDGDWTDVTMDVSYP